MPDTGYRDLAVISESFCPLRWGYLQVDLQHGRAKACCKTPFQPVRPAELAATGADAIFNSTYLLERRTEMLHGVRHQDCTSCWRAEDVGIQSYRQNQAELPMFAELTDALRKNPTVSGAVPRHIEVILGTECDLACSYCGPTFSKRWEHELTRLGPYPVSGGVPTPPEAQPPETFADTFARWLGENLADVRYIQFNGGEPLIQRAFHDFVGLIMDHPDAGDLQLGVITNLNTPPAAMRSLLDVLPVLHARHRFRFGVSIDAVGARAEYIRHGVNWARFDRNLRSLLEVVPDLDLQLAPTVSALSVGGLPDLVRYLIGLQAEYDARITIRPSLVMWPDFQSPLVLLPQDYAPLRQAREMLREHGQWPEFEARLAEIGDAAGTVTDPDRLRTDFRNWFEEYDRRRGTDLPATFGELTEFWRECAAARGRRAAAEVQ